MYEMKNESTVVLSIVSVLNIVKQEMYNEEVDMAKVSFTLLDISMIRDMHYNK